MAQQTKKADNRAAEWVRIDDLVPWADNPRQNESAVTMVVESIRRFGFAAPIIARAENRQVIAGHTRLKAAQQLGLEMVPVRFMDLDEDEAHALALADNKLNEAATWDESMLATILQGLEQASVPIDNLGWSTSELDELIASLEKKDEPLSDGELSDQYTKKIQAPVYEPKGERPPIDSLVDRSKTEQLVADIKAAKLDRETEQFLVDAAQRHLSFHFRKIAEWYCHADPTIQDLMERSGLVIIDFDKAIEHGFVHLSKRLAALSNIVADRHAK